MHDIRQIDSSTGGLEDAYRRNVLVPFEPPCRYFHSERTSFQILLVDLHSSRWVCFRVCECASVSESLVNAGYWTDAPGKPKIAFSIPMLNLYRRLLALAQTPLHAFIKSITFDQSELPSSVYTSFSVAFMEYRAAAFNLDNFTDMKIARREEVMGGCIACPRKGEVGDFHFSLDGNFRLHRYRWAGKHSLRPRQITNRFIDRFTLKCYLEECKATKSGQDGEDDTVGCGNHFKAGYKCPSGRRKKVFDETGAFGSFCARHELPLLFVDMYHGERYAYPNYLMQQLAKRRSGKQKIFLYFDRACKYVPHLQSQGFYQHNRAYTIGLLPKAHAYCHGYACLRLFHPLRNTGCGKTDGECCERCWSYMGEFAKITREMLSTNRHETLEDALHHFTYQKYFALKRSIMKKLLKAQIEHQACFYDFQQHRISMEYAESLFLSEKCGFFFEDDQVDNPAINGVEWSAATISLKPLLSDMRSLARERAVLIAVKRDGNLGQFRATAVEKSLKAIQLKLTKLLGDYNIWVAANPECGFEQITWADIGDRESMFWREGNDKWLATTKQIDSYSRLVRNEEEQHLLHLELDRLDKHLCDDIKTLREAVIEGTYDHQDQAKAFKILVERRVRLMTEMLNQGRQSRPRRINLMTVAPTNETGIPPMKMDDDIDMNYYGPDDLGELDLNLHSVTTILDDQTFSLDTQKILPETSVENTEAVLDLLAIVSDQENEIDRDEHSECESIFDDVYDDVGHDPDVSFTSSLSETRDVDASLT